MLYFTAHVKARVAYKLSVLIFHCKLVTVISLNVLLREEDKDNNIFYLGSTLIS